MKIRQTGKSDGPISIVLGAAIVLALSGCASAAPRSDGSPSTGSESSSISVSGEAVKNVGNVQVYGIANWEANWDRWCAFKHSQAGTGVTIKDSDGKVVGLASLESPTANITVNSKNDVGGLVSGDCVSAFTTDVESKSKFFTVEIEGVNGSVNMTRDELVAGPKLKIP